MQVLEVIEARELGLDDGCDTAMGIGRGVVVVLALVVDGNEILVGSEVAINVVAEVGNVGGVMGT